MASTNFIFPANLSELLAAANAVPIADSELALATLRELLGSGIKSRCERIKVDDTTDTMHIRRVILTAHERYADHTREITKQCNGLVLEHVDGVWKILSMPSAGFVPRGSIKGLDLSKYQIYDIRDGTIVTLYWYNGVPCLSSTNGYDVSNHCRVGDVTYMAALRDAAGINLDALDRNYSYTMGFRHSAYHPLADKKLPKIWLVRVTDLATGLPVDVDIGIPTQSPTVLITANPAQAISDLNKYALDQYLRTGTAHYGFILRSVGKSSDFILKSQLLRKLETLFYDNPRNSSVLTPANHEKYFALRAFLRYNDRAIYTQLFPQFDHYHKSFTTVFTNLTSRVVFLLKSGKHREVISGKSTLSTSMEAVATVMVEHIENANVINIADEHSRKIIEDFILSPEYLDWYFKSLV